MDSLTENDELSRHWKINRSLKFRDELTRLVRWKNRFQSEIKSSSPAKWLMISGLE